MGPEKETLQMVERQVILLAEDDASSFLYDRAHHQISNSLRSAHSGDAQQSIGSNENS